MTSLKRTARIAGLWYLGFTLGPFYLLYVPSHTIVRNDAAATAAKVLAHETLFRWGMLAESLGAVIFIALSLALYRLFEDVDRDRARQLVALVLVSSALSLVTLVFNASALLVFRGGPSFSGFDEPTRQAVGMLLIRMHSQANSINQIFWGLWLLPFGSLVVRSRFLPRWLGYWLLVDGIAWVIVGITWFLAPDSTDALFRYLQPIFFAEIVAMLWLLIIGAREPVAAIPASME
ncbi:protein of unknown function [Bryocella elongata]|uniref:DUF4386 domain-containing protein n=1 Tax=Bryocella elongata TaxID=863522 RepID=A0A1H6BQB0_9BACT|nr:DUF4386 domain-containing protein [Bryocella elongata]SEG62884.1 protein of unknown function [Bryocella elongata]